VSLPVAVLFCPGRGAYGREELGWLARHLRPGPVAQALAEADRERAAAGLPGLLELDAARSFRPSQHLESTAAAGLIFFGCLLQLESLRERYRIAAVAGNSLGWYTALCASGALDPLSGWRLVACLARLQAELHGGQVLTTTVDSEWREVPELVQAVESALAEVAAQGPGHYVARSIRLGGHEVLAGTEAGVRALLERLPRTVQGEREFPFRLAGHGPFHTALCAATAERAGPELAPLPWRQPRLHLIDGFGRIHSPWSADPTALLQYTAGPQVLETFDFSACVRVALREFQPDALLCAGPGSSLRAPVGHVVLREGQRGLRTKSQLFASGFVAT
jgi:[acyl-carrier-protein] S-malonyltransferase